MMGFVFNRMSALFWTAFYHAAGRVIFTKLGPGAKFQGWIDIPQRKGRISIGRNVHICRSVEFSVTNHAELIIADGTFIGRGTIISAHQRVSIGANVLVAEYVSIHDNNHNTHDPNLPIRCQGFEAESLEIGDDCWIGAKATLVKGAGLGRRCILGAGAVLTQKLSDNTLAAGVPAQPMDKKTVVLPAQPSLSPPWASKNRLALEPRVQCALCAGFDCDTAIPFSDIPVLRCQACGFLYSGQVMPEKMRADYYRNDFASPRHLLGQQLNAGMNFHVLKKILNLSRGISVLDAGCGYGFLLRLLGDKWQADVTGVEVSKRETSYAMDTLALAKIYPSLTEIPSHQQFDLVTCFEVIEHVREPVPFVRELLKRVTPGGCLVVMTDNFDSPASRRMGCEFPKWIPHSHVSHFTPATLEKCINRAGAEDVSFYSHTPWEILALAARSRLSAAKPPSACFDLDNVLATEMDRPFRLFALRKWLNKFSVPLSLKPNKNGSLIYAVVHPPHP
jgi:acetyltransferase-like isoleucine patch superfamily enzyme/2-polyprenyl-3-methyl-5-hydroxy-6-metoxy-1,4-benzoquinol methylase